jgi:hypothetical protein
LFGVQHHSLPQQPQLISLLNHLRYSWRLPYGLWWGTTHPASTDFLNHGFHYFEVELTSIFRRIQGAHILDPQRELDTLFEVRWSTDDYSGEVSSNCFIFWEIRMYINLACWKHFGSTYYVSKLVTLFLMLILLETHLRFTNSLSFSIFRSATNLTWRLTT